MSLVLVASACSIMMGFFNDYNYVMGFKQDIECTDDFKCVNCWDFLNGGIKSNTYPGGSFCRGVPFEVVESLVINLIVIIVSLVSIFYFLFKQKWRGKRVRNTVA
jgi:hypothetical protein